MTFGSPRAQRNFPLSLISNCEAVAGIEAKTGGALRKEDVQIWVFLKIAAWDSLMLSHGLCNILELDFFCIFAFNFCNIFSNCNSLTGLTLE